MSPMWALAPHVWMLLSAHVTEKKPGVQALKKHMRIHVATIAGQDSTESPALSVLLVQNIKKRRRGVGFILDIEEKLKLTHVCVCCSPVCRGKSRMLATFLYSSPHYCLEARTLIEPEAHWSPEEVAFLSAPGDWLSWSRASGCCISPSWYFKACLPPLNLPDGSGV